VHAYAEVRNPRRRKDFIYAPNILEIVAGGFVVRASGLA
jgi:hypothetical protein